LSQGKLGGKAAVAFGFFNRVKVGSLEVFNER
jgi:hypothetical protein